ncbi:MAG: hypothetical protein NVSMB17_06790 [Candidatus Dormibacteria bacterium]
MTKKPLQSSAREPTLDHPRTEFKLGRVERSILQTLAELGGIAERAAAVDAAFPDAVGARDDQPGVRDARRARAEAATSRAVVSLERKGLVQRQRNLRTGRTFLILPGITEVPGWEQLARAEEDLAAHCQKTARSWQLLASRARSRAASIRATRSSDETEGERSIDLRSVAELEGSTD